MHPIMTLITKIWEDRLTPTLVLDVSTEETSGFPEFVKKKFGSQLSIDLRAEYPLEPVHNNDELEISLAFSGTTSRVKIAWGRVKAVIIRENGQTFLVDHAMLARAKSLRGQLRALDRGHVPSPKPRAVPPPENAGKHAAPSTARPWTPRVIRGGKPN